MRPGHRTDPTRCCRMLRLQQRLLQARGRAGSQVGSTLAKFLPVQIQLKVRTRWVRAATVRQQAWLRAGRVRVPTQPDCLPARIQLSVRTSWVRAEMVRLQAWLQAGRVQVPTHPECLPARIQPSVATDRCGSRGNLGLLLRGVNGSCTKNRYTFRVRGLGLGGFSTRVLGLGFWVKRTRVWGLRFKERRRFLLWFYFAIQMSATPTPQTTCSLLIRKP